VITLPEPGESSTDHNDEIDGANPDDPDHPGDKDAESDNESAQSDSNVTATIEEAGQKLGIIHVFSIKVCPEKNPDNFCVWPFYNHFWPFLPTTYLYLSQNLDVNGHFKELN
jgi:hypothetical protein